MGVPGLMTYLTNCVTAWRDIDLEDSNAIVDGAAFAIHLFHSLRSEWRLGGDMRAYVRTGKSESASDLCMAACCICLGCGMGAEPSTQPSTWSCLRGHELTATPATWNGSRGCACVCAAAPTFPRAVQTLSLVAQLRLLHAHRIAATFIFDGARETCKLTTSVSV